MPMHSSQKDWPKEMIEGIKMLASLMPHTHAAGAGEALVAGDAVLAGEAMLQGVAGSSS